MSDLTVAPGTGVAGQLARRASREQPVADFLAAVEGLLGEAPVAAEEDVQTSRKRSATTAGDDGSRAARGDDQAALARPGLPDPSAPELPALLMAPPPAPDTGAAGDAAPEPAGIFGERPRPAPDRVIPAPMALPAEPEDVTSAKALPPSEIASAIEAAEAPAAAPAPRGALPLPPTMAPATASLPLSAGAFTRLRATVTAVATHFAPVVAPTPEMSPRVAVAAPTREMLPPVPAIAPAEPAAEALLPASPRVLPPASPVTAAIAAAQTPEAPLADAPRAAAVAAVPPRSRAQPAVAAAAAAALAAAPAIPSAPVRDASPLRTAPVASDTPVEDRPPLRSWAPSGPGERTAPLRGERAVAPVAEREMPAPATATPGGLGVAEIRRLGTTILDAARGIAAPERPAGIDSATMAASGPVRVVSLTLNPEHLGRVTVTLRLAGDRLSLRLEAENPETARMIAGDSQALVELLDGEGYGVDSLVSAAGGEVMAAGTGPAAPAPGPAPAPPPDSGTGSQRQPAQHMRDEGRAPSRSPESQDSETSSHEEAAPPGRVGRLYV